MMILIQSLNFFHIPKNEIFYYTKWNIKQFYLNYKSIYSIVLLTKNTKIYVCLSVLCKHVQHATWGCMIYLAYLCFPRLLCATEKPARVQRIFLFFSCLSFRENLLAPLAGRSENHNKLRSDGTWHQAGNCTDKPGQVGKQSACGKRVAPGQHLLLGYGSSTAAIRGFVLGLLSALMVSMVSIYVRFG